MNINITSYGRGTPLVFFHGWGFDSQVWLPLVPLLQPFYQIILVDLPGFGRSSLMNWQMFHDELIQILPPKFILVGWSMGGLYATRFALSEQERVLALININSTPCFIRGDTWPGVGQDMLVNFHQNLNNDFSQTLDQFIRMQLRHTLVNGQQYIQPSSAALKIGLNTLATWDLRSELHQLSQPTCFMFGRLDSITPWTTMEVMQQQYPQFNYILFKKAAHMPFLSHPDTFVTELMAFLK